VLKQKFSRSIISLIILVAISIAFPMVTSPYYTSLATMFFINAILVVSFRFIATMGEFSFAHVAFMGIGSYATALLTTRLGWPFWLTLPMGGIAAATISLVISYPLLRMKGFYFFVASFAAGQSMYLIWTKFKFFGAFLGISPVPPPKLAGINFSEFTPYYYLVFVIAILCMIILYRLEHSRVGAAIKAVAANDLLAQSVGINVRLYKTIAFITGSFFAGVAGVLLAHRMGYVGPDQFTFTYNLYVIVWTITGGLYSFNGPITGLVVLTIVDIILRNYKNVQPYTPLIYGAVLIITLLFLPRGLISLPQRVSAIIKRKKVRAKLVNN